MDEIEKFIRSNPAFTITMMWIAIYIVVVTAILATGNTAKAGICTIAGIAHVLTLMFFVRSPYNTRVLFYVSVSHILTIVISSHVFGKESAMWAAISVSVFSILFKILSTTDPRKKKTA